MVLKFLFDNSRHGEILEFPFLVVKMDQQKQTACHEHDFVELVLILRGTAEHLLNDNRTSLHARDILIIPRGLSHAFRNCSEDFSLINFLFLPERLPLPRLDLYLLPGYRILFAKEGMRPNPQQLIVHCEEKEFELLLQLSEKILGEDDERQPGYFFTMFGFFMALSGHIARLFSHVAIDHENHFSHIANVIAYLNKHYKEPLVIADLCRVAHMSRSTLQRNFFRATGTTPVEYQIRLRIAEAVTLLQSTNQSITAIGVELGFFDSSYFGKHFKRITGMSPRQYRLKDKSPDVLS